MSLNRRAWDTRAPTLLSNALGAGRLEIVFKVFPLVAVVGQPGKRFLRGGFHLVGPDDVFIQQANVDLNPAHALVDGQVATVPLELRPFRPVVVPDSPAPLRVFFRILQHRLAFRF